MREAGLLLLLALAAYLLVALCTYDVRDPSWSYSASTEQVHNAGGAVGAFFADIALYLFGYLAFLFPIMIGWGALQVYRWQRREEPIRWGVLGLRFGGFIATVVTGSVLATLHFKAIPGTVPLAAGGVLGDLVGTALVNAFNFVGATLFALAAFLGGVTLFTGLSWISLMDLLGRVALRSAAWALARLRVLSERLASRRAQRARAEVIVREVKRPRRRKTPQIEPALLAAPEGERARKERQIPLFKSDASTDDKLPSVNLLEPPQKQSKGYSNEVLAEMSKQVEVKLQDFGVEVEVVAVQPGPVITRFELQPAPGVKVNQISNLEKDLARSLSVMAVRVVEVIPGKSVVGLEIPNEQRQVIAYSEIIRSKEFERAKSPLTVALGKDIGGHPVVADLARMPHLLVAGTTGSGKSVGVNGMILSLLYKNTPEQVRLILIDPKMLELSVYDGIPHLLTPVVTDMKDAGNALRWCVEEMERRYQLMAALGVRNIGGFNKKLIEAHESGEPILDPLFKPDPAQVFSEDEPLPQAPELEPLPYIVIVVDEFADMMMVVGKRVEELIARLAQKARAAGIHLILATQRPSVDVITGLIKANIPTRIAFQVSSKIDSRTILDQMGAEALLGQGDMLYLAPGTGLPQRVHGAFVTDQEVHKVVGFLKQAGEPQYIDDVLSDPGENAAAIPGLTTESDESDPLYDQAVSHVLESRRASVSGIQRRLKIGYNRAARMVEEMEAAGLVGPLQSNGTREILVPSSTGD